MIRYSKKRQRRTIKTRRHKLNRRQQRGGAFHIDLGRDRVPIDGSHYKITVTQLNDDNMIIAIYHGQARVICPVAAAHCREGELFQDQSNQLEYVIDGKGILIEFSPDGLAFTVYQGDFANDRINGRGKKSYYTIPPSDHQFSDLSAQFRQLRTLDDLTGMTPAQLTDLTLRLARHTPNMVYKGNWVDNVISGVGKMTYANQDVYVGHWQNAKKSGRGKMTYANQDVYDGHWQNDMKSGMGKMTYANQDVYVGHWQNNMRSGRGQMTYANHDVYVGHWQYDMRSGGRGQMTHHDGRVYVGEWHNDQLLVFGRPVNSALSTPPIFHSTPNLSGFGGVASIFSSANVPSGVNIFGRPPPPLPRPPPPP